MYDVIVVGARVAGAPTALLLVRRGYRVLLVDRARFPSDTLSTHYIHQPGVACLDRWGLLDRLIATGCPPIRQGLFDIGPVQVTGSPPPAGSIDAAYCPRRTVLDALLVEAADKAGVEVWEGTSVRELLFEGDRVAGIRSRTVGGASVEARAHIVVGADGMHSLVARSVQAPEYDIHPTLTCGYYTYWADVPVAGLELYARAGRLILVFPTHDDQVCIAVMWPRAEFHAYRADIEGNYRKTLEIAPDLAERVRAGRRAERFAGTADAPNFFRRPFGPGWALAGDAGYHRDACTGQGITDAFLDAESLSAALDAELSGQESFETALAAHEAARNAARRPMYEYTLRLAALPPIGAAQVRLYSAIAADPVESDRFFGVLAGTVPVSDVFGVRALQRILGARRAGAVGGRAS